MSLMLAAVLLPEAGSLELFRRGEDAFRAGLARREKNTNMCPLNGSWPNCERTSADRPSMPLRPSTADRKSTRLNSSHGMSSRMPSSA